MKPANRDRWAAELLKAMDRVESLKSDKAQLVKDFAGQIADAEMKVKHWRNLLGGKGGEQLPLEPPDEPREPDDDDRDLPPRDPDFDPLPASKGGGR